MLIQLLRKDACEKRPFYFFIYPPPHQHQSITLPLFPICAISHLVKYICDQI